MIQFLSNDDDHDEMQGCQLQKKKEIEQPNFDMIIKDWLNHYFSGKQFQTSQMSTLLGGTHLFS
jgi:hypothetical protein